MDPTARLGYFSLKRLSERTERHPLSFVATRIDAGHSAHHEAETAAAAIAWGEQILSRCIGVVWICNQETGENMPLAEFKRRRSDE
jgi:hypothetical protein